MMWYFILNEAYLQVQTQFRFAIILYANIVYKFRIPLNCNTNTVPCIIMTESLTFQWVVYEKITQTCSADWMSKKCSLFTINAVQVYRVYCCCHQFKYFSGNLQIMAQPIHQSMLQASKAMQARAFHIRNKWFSL